MIDERYKRSPSYMNMIKTLPRKLSPETLEIVENFDIIMKLHDQFQSIGRITKELFDEFLKTGIPSDIEVNYIRTGMTFFI